MSNRNDIQYSQIKASWVWHYDIFYGLYLSVYSLGDMWWSSRVKPFGDGVYIERFAINIKRDRVLYMGQHRPRVINIFTMEVVCEYIDFAAVVLLQYIFVHMSSTEI